MTATEQEIDVRRYWSAIAARWWLPVLGLIAGAAIAYAVSLGGADVWRGNALVSLGQPVTPSGAQVQSLSTNPAAAGEIAGSAAAQRRAERVAGLPRGALSGRVSVAAVKGNLSRLGQNPLVRLRVEGENRRVALAANALARTVVDRVSDYADAKISVLEEGIDGLESALAEDVERAKVVEDAVARKVTAQSRRNQIVVGAFLGLLLGLATALLWDSALALRRR